MRKKTPIALVLIVIAAVVATRLERGPTTAAPGADAIVDAFAAKQSGVWVEAEGPIVHILPFDDKPPRHQNFLVEIAPNHTVKISHNVDLAPRAPVRKGTRIRFRGRYEYNPKGGVVHWTHHDPKGKLAGGALEYEGKTYR